MLASAPYAASNALCQMAKQSNSAQYRSRSENSKPKKVILAGCRVGSMAPPDIKTNLYMLVMYKEGENVTRSAMPIEWRRYHYYYFITIIHARRRLTSQFRHQQSAWKNHNKMCKEIIAKNEELDPRRRERLDSFLEKQCTMAKHSGKTVVRKTWRFSSQHDLLHCVMLPESIAIQMKLISILKWIWEFGCFQLRI